MSDDIVSRLQCAYRKGNEFPCEECTFCAARAEIERLRWIINDYATAADGIVLNWSKDRYGNWVAFDTMHHALLEEARRG